MQKTCDVSTTSGRVLDCCYFRNVLRNRSMDPSFLSGLRQRGRRLPNREVHGAKPTAVYVPV
jgi:hypothetical protein